MIEADFGQVIAPLKVCVGEIGRLKELRPGKPRLTGKDHEGEECLPAENRVREIRQLLELRAGKSGPQPEPRPLAGRTSSAARASSI
jgi:hypothetical protein